MPGDPFDAAAARRLASITHDALHGDGRDPDDAPSRLCTCAICRSDFYLREEAEPTALCDQCAWDTLGKLGAALGAACDRIAELEARLAPTRGDYLVAYASAGAARYEAAEAYTRAISDHRQKPGPSQKANLDAAKARLDAAIEAERSACASLDAYERVNDLDLTHPDLA